MVVRRPTSVLPCRTSGRYRTLLPQLSRALSVSSRGADRGAAELGHAAAGQQRRKRQHEHAQVPPFRCLPTREEQLSRLIASGQATTAPPAQQKLDGAEATAVAGEFDVLVVGGGATGCGAALDAAMRGLSVALVERRDFGAQQGRPAAPSCRSA
jgi:threonine dehydrogenase-like Zn-dependent dehydrogenase